MGKSWYIYGKLLHLRAPHLYLRTPIQCIKLAIRFGAHKPPLGSLLLLAGITMIMMSGWISCFCVNCSCAAIGLCMAIYIPVMCGNKPFEIGLTNYPVCYGQLPTVALYKLEVFIIFILSNAFCTQPWCWTMCFHLPPPHWIYWYCSQP